MWDKDETFEYNRDETWFWNHIKTETINNYPKKTRLRPTIVQNLTKDRDKNKSLVYFSIETEPLANQCHFLSKMGKTNFKKWLRQEESKRKEERGRVLIYVVQCFRVVIMDFILNKCWILYYRDSSGAITHRVTFYILANHYRYTSILVI